MTHTEGPNHYGMGGNAYGMQILCPHGELPLMRDRHGAVAWFHKFEAHYVHTGRCVIAELVSDSYRNI